MITRRTLFFALMSLVLSGCTNKDNGIFSRKQKKYERVCDNYNVITKDTGINTNVQSQNNNDISPADEFGAALDDCVTFKDPEEVLIVQLEKKKIRGGYQINCKSVMFAGAPLMIRSLGKSVVQLKLQPVHGMQRVIIVDNVANIHPDGQVQIGEKICDLIGETNISSKIVNADAKDSDFPIGVTISGNQKNLKRTRVDFADDDEDNKNQQQQYPQYYANTQQQAYTVHPQPITTSTAAPVMYTTTTPNQNANIMTTAPNANTVKVPTATKPKPAVQNTVPQPVQQVQQPQPVQYVAQPGQPGQQVVYQQPVQPMINPNPQQVQQPVQPQPVPQQGQQVVYQQPGQPQQAQPMMNPQGQPVQYVAQPGQQVVYQQPGQPQPGQPVYVAPRR